MSVDTAEQSLRSSTAPAPLAVSTSRATFASTTLRTTSKGLGALLVTALAWPVAGCDTGLQAKLFEARDKRYKTAKEAVYAIEIARNQAMTESLPAPDAKFDGDNHPMMIWRRAGAARTDGKALQDLAKSAKPLPGATIGVLGTPAEPAALVGASYLKDVGEYWSGATTLSRYLTSIDNFGAAVARARSEADDKIKTTKGWEWVEPPFSDEARFDEWFVHAASYLQLSNIENREMAWNAMHPAYGVAFGISRRMGEGSSDYVSRLCFLEPSLKDKCKGVPHEYRAALVDRAFVEKLSGWAKGYRVKTERAKIFDDVAKRFAEAMDQAIATPLVFKETLVLPSTVAAIGGRSGVTLTFSEETGITALTDAEVKLADKWTGQVPNNLAADLEKMLVDLRDKPGNRIDYQRVVVELAGATPTSTVFQVLKAIPAKLGEGSGVKDVFLLGRRRLDDSMRLAALKVRVPTSDDAPNIGYKFKEDGATTACKVVGRVGDPPTGRKDEFDLEIRADRIRVAQTTWDEEKAERVMGDTVQLGTMADLTQLKAWLDEHPGRVRAFVPMRQSYEQLMMLLSDLLYKCGDEEVGGDDASKPKLTRTCGVSEARATSFVLGLCD